MLESDMKDFSCTLPLGNSEDLFKIFYFFQNLLNFSSRSIISKQVHLENIDLKVVKNNLS